MPHARGKAQGVYAWQPESQAVFACKTSEREQKASQQNVLSVALYRFSLTVSVRVSARRSRNSRAAPSGGTRLHRGGAVGGIPRSFCHIGFPRGGSSRACLAWLAASLRHGRQSGLRRLNGAQLLLLAAVILPNPLIGDTGVHRAQQDIFRTGDGSARHKRSSHQNRRSRCPFSARPHRPRRVGCGVNDAPRRVEIAATLQTDAQQSTEITKGAKHRAYR